MNPVAQEFGSVPGGVMDRDFEEVVRLVWARSRADEIVEIFHHVLTTGEPFLRPEQAEFRADRQRTEYVEWRVDRTTMPDGRHGLVCYFRDITAHVQARDKITQSEERFRSLVGVITDVTWRADEDGRFFAPQETWSAFTGQGNAALVGHGWLLAVHPEDRTRVDAEWRDVCARPRLFVTKTRLWHAASDTYHHVEIRATPVPDAAGSTREWVGACRDIHADRANEQEREAMLARERAARGVAEQALKIKDEFLATLSHELRTPLNAILGWSRLLKADLTDEQRVRQAAEVIERNGRIQAQLISDMLDISRLISGRLHLDVADLDLPQVVDEAVVASRPAAEAKGIRIEVSKAGLPGVVRGDAARLQQVVRNLLSNAIKFTPKDGRIDVAIDGALSSARIRVGDTGEGIDPQFLPQVFERFTQADASTSRRHGGLGIGLAIVKEIVHLHGGRVTATSSGRDQGATFVVELPYAKPAVEFEPRQRSWMRAEPSAAMDDASLPSIDLAGMHVLVVDDERDARMLVKRILESAGARATIVASTAEALELFERGGDGDVDVLVSDIGMPGSDGYELIAEVRRRGHRVPALALTAYARSEDITRATRAGFDAHASKPVNATELLRQVAALRSGPPPEERSVQRSGTRSATS